MSDKIAIYVCSKWPKRKREIENNSQTAFCEFTKIEFVTKRTCFVKSRNPDGYPPTKGEST